jgi:hypothetical protein
VTRSEASKIASKLSPGAMKALAYVASGPKTDAEMARHAGCTAPLVRRGLVAHFASGGLWKIRIPGRRVLAEGHVR